MTSFGPSSFSFLTSCPLDGSQLKHPVACAKTTLLSSQKLTLLFIYIRYQIWMNIGYRMNITNIECDRAQVKWCINYLQVVWLKKEKRSKWAHFSIISPAQRCLQQKFPRVLGLKIGHSCNTRVTERRRRRDQSISPATLRNMSLCSLIRFRDNKWKLGLSGPFAFTNGSA